MLNDEGGCDRGRDLKWSYVGEGCGIESVSANGCFKIGGCENEEVGGWLKSHGCLCGW